MVDLKHLENRIEWKLHFTIQSPLHIGDSMEKTKENKSNKEANALKLSLLDLPNLSEAKNLVIPGSTLRGVSRSFFEQLITSMSLRQDAVQQIDNLYGKIGKESSLKGRIWFSDGLIPKENYSIKYQTPINRITQKPLVPMQIQTINPGTSFLITLTVENVKDYELGMIGLLLRAFKEQHIAIGHGQSRGLGRIQLTACDTTIYPLGNKPFFISADKLVAQGFKMEKSFLSNQGLYNDVGDRRA